MQTEPSKSKATGRSGIRARLRRFVRYWSLRIVRIQATPHNISIGLAAGVFVGLLPVLPFQTILAIGLAFVLKGSKLAAALGTWVSNPLNWLPVYMMFYYVGRAVVPFDVPPFSPTQLSLAEMFHIGWKLAVAMLVGGLVVATPSAVLSYFIGKRVVQRYQHRRALRLANKRLRDLREPRGSTPAGQPAQTGAVTPNEPKMAGKPPAPGEPR